jgi:2-methylcitrate dehydratase PrpD
LEYPKGDPREPMTEADLDAKVEALCGDRFDVPALKEMVYSCEKLSAIEFMKTL